MAMGMGLVYLGGGNYFALILQIGGVRIFGAATSAVVICGSISGVVSPAVSGFLIKNSGNYTIAFVLAGGAVLLGAAAIALFVKGGRLPIADLPQQNRVKAATFADNGMMGSNLASTGSERERA
jgi:hypothetical protein